MKKLTIPAMLALAVIVAAALSPLAHAPFLFDDHYVIESDPAVRHVDSNGRVEVNPFEDLLSSPRPLRQLTHRIDFLLFGDGTAGPHAVNIVLHLLVGLIGFVLLRQLGLSPGTAWTTTALFLLNPVCVEAIGVLSHRKELLSTLFILLGVSAALRRPERPSAVAMVFFFLAVCAKETAAIFPAFVLLVFLAKSTGCPDAGKGSFAGLGRPVLKTLALYASVAAVFAGLSWLQIHHSMNALGGNPADDAFRAGHFAIGTALGPALSAALRAIPRWVMTVFWPFGHSIDPDFDLNRPLLSGESLLAAVSLVFIAVALVRLFRSRSGFFFPLAWSSVALAPYLWPPFLQSGATQVLADRYAYNAAFGAAWLAALALEMIPVAKIRRAATAVLVVVFGLSTFSLSKGYDSEVSLWSRACRLNPWSFQAAHNHAMAIWREKKDAKAADLEFKRMMELEPAFDYGICSRAQIRAEAGNPFGAMALLDEAILKRPQSWQLLRQRGIVRFGLGRMRDACRDFAKAEKHGAEDSFFRLRYGEALIRTAHWKEARRQILLAGGDPDAKEEVEKSILLVSDPPIRRGGILIVGDSLPHGTATIGEDGHEHGLAEYVSRESGLPARAFEDKSVPGSIAQDLPASVKERVRMAPKPAICVIWSGHNDAFFGTDPESILQSLATTALECRKAGARPIIIGPVPVRSVQDRDRNAQERSLAKLNGLLRDFCAEAGIEFVDARALLAAAFPDSLRKVLDPGTGNHLLEPGMKIVAAKVSAAIKKVAH